MGPTEHQNLAMLFQNHELEQLYRSPASIDQSTDVITDYIKFCENLVIPEIEVKIYPNNKNWLNKEVCHLIKQKHRAHYNNEDQVKRELNSEIKEQIRLCKKQYGKKLDRKFNEGDPKSVRNAMTSQVMEIVTIVTIVTNCVLRLFQTSMITIELC